jgi:hypothetical protein
MTQDVLYKGWTEPFVALLFALTVLLAARRAVSAAILLGLLVASKQYGPLFLPLGLALLAPVRDVIGGLRMGLVAVSAAVATVLPFLVWNATALLYSTVTVHLLQPFRLDAIGVPALIARAGLTAPPSWLGFALSGVAVLYCAAFAPRTRAGFCAASALALALFFAFGKQAAINYYFLVVVVLAAGIAFTAMRTADPSPHPTGTQ